MAEPTLPDSQPRIQLPGASRTSSATAPFARLGDGAAAFVLLLALGATLRGLPRGAMLAGRGILRDPGGFGRAWREWWMKGAAMATVIEAERDYLIEEVGIEDVPSPYDEDPLREDALSIYRKLKGLQAGRVVRITCAGGDAEDYAGMLRRYFKRLLGSRVIHLEARTSAVIVATRGVNWR